MGRIGKCKKCKKEFKSDSVWQDIYSYPFKVWFKLCPECYNIEMEKGSIKLCNIVEGVIKEVK